MFIVCVITVTETWFKNKHDVCFTSLAGYTLFRRDREGRKGGGVAIYVRHSLCSKLFPHQVTRKTLKFCGYSFLSLPSISSSVLFTIHPDPTTVKRTSCLKLNTPLLIFPMYLEIPLFYYVRI